jgi:hypothetical protein
MPDLTPQAQQLQDQEVIARILGILKNYFEGRGLVMAVVVQTFDVMLVKTSVSVMVGEGPPTPNDLQDMLAGTIVDYLKKIPGLGITSFVKTGSVLS